MLDGDTLILKDESLMLQKYRDDNFSRKSPSYTEDENVDSVFRLKIFDICLISLITCCFFLWILFGSDIIPNVSLLIQAPYSYSETNFVNNSLYRLPHEFKIYEDSPVLVNKTRRLFFLHFSSCAGTSLSSYMMKIGHSRAHQLSQTFNLPWKYSGDRRAWMRIFSEFHKSAVDCTAVLRWVKKHGIRFFASEAFYPFIQNVCPLFDHITIICDPMHRAKRRILDEYYKWEMNEVLSKLFAEDTKVLSRGDSENIPGTADIDSPLLRRILGREAFALPFGALNRSHYLDAITHLKQYTLVVPSNALGDPRLVQWLSSRYCNKKQLCQHDSIPSMGHSRSAVPGLLKTWCPHMKNATLDKCAQKVISKENLSLLEEHNQWDVELYEFAKNEWEDAITNALKTDSAIPNASNK